MTFSRLSPPSFPNSVWECNCSGNSVAPAGKRSFEDKCVPKQSLGTRSGMRCVAFLLLVLACARGFGADDSAHEKRFLSNTRQLVFEGKRSGEGYFSADGKKLIFQSEREPENPFYQQYILDLETGETT